LVALAAALAIVGLVVVLVASSGGGGRAPRTGRPQPPPVRGPTARLPRAERIVAARAATRRRCARGASWAA